MKHPTWLFMCESKKMNNQKLATWDGFQYWLACMDDYLEVFIAQFPAEDRHRLDYSPSSLDVVEEWILKTYSDTDDMIVPSESERVNRVACYVGETFRKTLGGKWDIRLDDPKFAYYSMPILTGSYDAECPLRLVTTAANRRTGRFLRMVLENS